MLWWQLVVEVVALLVVISMLAHFLSQFKCRYASYCCLFIIPLLFTIGFTLRLTTDKSSIDLGYFFTEISYLFTYLLFTAALILGQKKYWKVR